jgi:hypothetical protein
MAEGWLPLLNGFRLKKTLLIWLKAEAAFAEWTEVAPDSAEYLL